MNAHEDSVVDMKVMMHKITSVNLDFVKSISRPLWSTHGEKLLNGHRM